MIWQCFGNEKFELECLKFDTEVQFINISISAGQIDQCLNDEYKQKPNLFIK